jgi:hypothetical protein
MKPNPNERREKPQREQQQQSPGQQGQQGQQQQDAGSGGQYGEGNYKATRDYDRGLKEHLQNHDVEREARDAAPHSPTEEKEMEDAERKGRSRAKGGGEEDMRQSPDIRKEGPEA